MIRWRQITPEPSCWGLAGFTDENRSYGSAKVVIHPSWQKAVHIIDRQALELVLLICTNQNKVASGC